MELLVDNPPPSDLIGTLEAGFSATWSSHSYKTVLDLCRQFRPDVAHVHNFWMKLSPSVHAACREFGAATVQTLHNFRLFCANALFLRSGEVCEDCVGHVPWRGVVRKCYRNSLVASAAVAAMMVGNRRRHTWELYVDAFIALTEFSRGKFVACGLPAGRIFVKPNFFKDCGAAPDPPSASHTIVYAGRLSQEKGVHLLLSAWSIGRVGGIGKLLIIGSGPERDSLRQRAQSLGLLEPQVVFADQKTPAEVLQLIGEARAVAVPSLWYEHFPMTVIESYSRGRPVVVADQGGLAEIVEGGREGLKFPTASATGLASALRTILTDGALADRMGANARATYLARYTPDSNFDILLHIYEAALAARSGAASPNHAEV